MKVCFSALCLAVALSGLVLGVAAATGSGVEQRAEDLGAVPCTAVPGAAARAHMPASARRRLMQPGIGAEEAAAVATEAAQNGQALAPHENSSGSEGGSDAALPANAAEPGSSGSAELPGAPEAGDEGPAGSDADAEAAFAAITGSGEADGGGGDTSGTAADSTPEAAAASPATAAPSPAAVAATAQLAAPDASDEALPGSSPTPGKLPGTGTEPQDEVGRLQGASEKGTAAAANAAATEVPEDGSASQQAASEGGGPGGQEAGSAGAGGSGVPATRSGSGGGTSDDADSDSTGPTDSAAADAVTAAADASADESDVATAEAAMDAVASEDGTLEAASATAGSPAAPADTPAWRHRRHRRTGLPAVGEACGWRLT
jgi:hypothetical protein